MKTPRPARAVLWSAAFLSVAMPAGAAEPARMPAVATTGHYLARMDTDRDGRVSLPEFQAWMGYAFARMDVDRDGIVEPHELPGGKGKPVALDEHRQRLAATFARQDRDRSGYLDAGELASPPQ